MARSGRALVGGAGVVVALVWLIDIAQPPLWTDEALTLRRSDSWSAVTSDFHPPLSYAAFRSWRLLVPDEVAWLRVLPAVCGLATIACWLGFWRSRARAGETGRLAVAVAVGLTAVSPHVLLYGRMIRYFSIAALLLAVTVILWWRAMEHARRPAVVATVIAAAALGTTNYVAALFAGAALTGFAVARRRDRLRLHLAVWLAAGLVAGIVVWASTLSSSPAAEAGGVDRFAVSAVFPLWSATVGETVNVFDLVLVLPAVAGWLVLATAAARRLRQPSDVVMLSGLLVVGGVAAATVGGALISLDHTAVQSPKLFMPFAPALYLLAGCGAQLLVDRGRAQIAAFALAGVALAWVPGVVHLHTGDDFLYSSYALPWDDVVDDLVPRLEQEAARPSDVAVVSADPALSYLLAIREVPADVLELEADSVRVEYDGAAPAGEYDLFIVLDRQRVNAELDRRLGGIGDFLRTSGYEEVERRSYGSIDDNLRRLQERLVGRDISESLVTMVVYGRQQAPA